jgi:hypothetical protein
MKEVASGGDRFLLGLVSNPENGNAVFRNVADVQMITWYYNIVALKP